MPALSRIAPKGQQTESFDSPYRTETSFKNFSTFLNRPLTVHSRNPNQYARFCLLDVLKHIDINKAILKGSTARHWKSDKPPADIDLQLSCTNSLDKKKLSQTLLGFLNSHSNRSIKDNHEIKEKVWFSRVRYQMQDAWVRLIVSVGYPQQDASTLDLNFTNYRGIAHDAIHASQAIQFDCAQRKAFSIGSWHPNLVDFLQKNQLLWFNPDIDEGLGRLAGQRPVEGQHHGLVHAAALQLRQLVAQRAYARRRDLGPAQGLGEVVARMGLEGQHAGGHATLGSFSRQQGQHGLVTPVNTIEIADGDGAGRFSPWMVEASKNLHGTLCFQ